MARMIMMLHASIHWPEMSDPSLWPMAVAHAVFLYNHVPNLDLGVICMSGVVSSMYWT
jgi:uncharacterized membrane protein YhhN